jgi:hypothetical protein
LALERKKPAGTRTERVLRKVVKTAPEILANTKARIQ